MRTNPTPFLFILPQIKQFYFRSGHVLPFYANPDIYTCQASDKTKEITGHQAESFPKPPTDPAKKRDAE